MRCELGTPDSMPYPRFYRGIIYLGRWKFINPEHCSEIFSHEIMHSLIEKDFDAEVSKAYDKVYSEIEERNYFAVVDRCPMEAFSKGERISLIGKFQGGER